MGAVGVMLLAGAVSVPMAVSACGGREAAAPTTTRAATSGACKTAPRALVTVIATRLTEHETLRDARAVRSETKRVWFVSAEIDGPGLEGDGEIGTWAKAGPLAPAGGAILAVDTVFAQVLSGWEPGDRTYSDVTMEDAGAEESRACVRNR
ncbi:MAG: hypothetical protein ACJ744_05195 [Gaiellaceae bacterium]|jgi:hypothetical protein